MYGYDPSALGLEIGKWSNKSNGEIHCACPFHETSKTTTASFNIVTGKFYCFSCGKSSNPYEIANQTGGSVYRAKVDLKVADERDNWTEILKLPIALDNTYLFSRGLNNLMIKNLGIREGNKFIAIPVRNRDGDTVGFVKRFVGSFFSIRYVNVGCEDGKLPLWGLEQYNPKETIFLTEGIFGAINLRKYGLQAMATLGAILSPQIHFVLKDAIRIYGWFDDDNAGYMACARLVTFHDKARVILPGCEVDEIPGIKIQETIDDINARSTFLLADIFNYYSGDVHDYQNLIKREIKL